MADELSQETARAFGVTEVQPIPIVPTVSEATLMAEREKALKTDKDVSFLGLLSTARQEEHIDTTLLRNKYRFSNIAKQPVADLTPEITSSLVGNLDSPDAIEEVLEAAKDVSYDYAMQMSKDFQVTQSNRLELEQAGWKGTLATVLAAMFDPTELVSIGATTAAVSAVSGPAAPVTGTATAAGLTAKRGYNVYRATKLGSVVGATEAAAFEAIRARLKYDITGGDVLLAGLTGGVLGGSISGVTTAFARNRKFQELSQKVALGEELTPNEKAFYDANNVDRLTQRIIAEVERRGDLDDVDATDVPRSVGEITEAEARATPKQLGGKVLAPLRKRLSVFNLTKNSENGFVRAAADRLGLNSSGNVDRTVVGASASEYKAMLEHIYRSKFSRSLYINRKNWSKRTGRDLTDFNILVSRAIRGGVDDTLDPEVRKVAQEVMEQQRELGNMAIKHNVGGFTTGVLDKQPNYLPRLFSDERISTLRTKFGNNLDTAVAELVEKSIRNAQPDIDKNLAPDVIGDMARGYAKTVLSRRFTSMHRAFEFNMEDLRKAMQDENIPDAQIDQLIDTLTKNTRVKGHKRSRPRLLLDENTSVDVRLDNGSIEQLKFTDLLEEDIENLNNAYVFQMSGAIGLARNGIDTNDAGSSLESLITKMRNEAQTINQSADTLNKEVEALQFMYDGITGRLGFKEGDPSFGTRQTLRRVREVSFMMHMGMSGMAALMELTNVLMENSLPVLLRSMPQYRKMLKIAADGKLDNAMIRELEELTGLGTDVLTGKFTRVSRFEGDAMEITDDARITKTDEWLGRGREATALLSGLTPVTAGLRRMSMLNYATAWARAARKNDNPYSKIKMEQLGIDEATSLKIRSQILKHSTFKDKEKTILESLNTKAWDKDAQDALDAFQVSAYRDTTQNVQEMSIGSTNAFLRGEWGKTVFQFLSFPLAAMEQQAMRLGVRAVHGDATTVTKILLSSMFMGTLMYTGRVYLNAEGRGDRDDYIKKQLSPARLAEGAISQIGAASTFGLVYDITTGAMDGNNYAITPAAVSILQKILGSGKAIVEGDMTEAEIRALLRLLPMSSLYGARSLLNQAANELAN